MCKSCWASTFGKPILSKSTIKKISDKHKERLKKYQILRDEFLKENPICMFPGCNSKDVECHHAAGRIGENLFNEFRSLCHKHHMYVEAHPNEAQELNLSISRIKRND